MASPILSVSQMREWEIATWATGVSEHSVIHNVGRRLAERVMERTKPGDRLLLLAGRGNNGADVRAMVAHLSHRTIELIDVIDPVAALAEVSEALSRHPEWVVDGLFGIGLSRTLDEFWIRLVNQINESQLPVLSVDVPSGLNADTGIPEGAAIMAAWTVCVGAIKQGLLAGHAMPYVGKLDLLSDIGLSTPPGGQVQWTVGADFSNFPPRRSVGAHKGDFGHLVIMAGSLGYHGAAVLAARAAQRARPGLISLVVPPEVYFPTASQLQSVMVHSWSPGWELPEKATAVLMGPGLASPHLSQGFRKDVLEVWKRAPLPVVADASALDWLREAQVLRRVTRIVTPHPGEAGRMLSLSPSDIQSDRCGIIRRISTMLEDAWVVLKGHQTVIGRAAGELYINSSGNPGLAQGGSGDVLAGYLAGLLAQPSLQDDVGKLLKFAVWHHGAVADELEWSRSNWTVEELVDRLGN